MNVRGSRLAEAARITVLVFLAGCTYRLPPRPLQLTATGLDGKVISAATLQGKPYVISLWLPG